MFHSPCIASRVFRKAPSEREVSTQQGMRRRVEATTSDEASPVLFLSDIEQFQARFYSITMTLIAVVTTHMCMTLSSTYALAYPVLRRTREDSRGR
jgi:hypothetical protein